MGLSFLANSLRKFKPFFHHNSISSCPPRSILWHTLNEKYNSRAKRQLVDYIVQQLMIPERRSPEHKKIFPWSPGQAELDWIPGVLALTVLYIPFLEGKRARKQPNTHSFQTKNMSSSSCFQLSFHWIDFC